MAEIRPLRELVDAAETALAGALLKLPSSYVVLPHLSIPRHAWPQEPDQADALVVGPNGVFVVDYRHWHGRLSPDPEGGVRLFYPSGEASERRAHPGEALAGKAQAVGAFLAERGIAAGPVRALQLFPDRLECEAADIGAEVCPLAGAVAALVEAPAPEALPADRVLAIADQVRPAAPRRLVNQYQITSRMTRTQGKTTYLAFDTAQERPVLLQELQYDPYQQPAQLERTRNELLREAKLTMLLDHPHIVKVIQVLPKDDCYYVATEWIEGCRTLAAYLAEKGRLEVPEALAITRALAGALAHAHAQGVVHRDIRPENVLVAPGSVVKIANFGLAKKADLATRSTFDLRQMAQENPFVAPEFRLGQAGVHQVDQRADVFSLAALCYRLLTGRAPAHLDEQYFEHASALAPGVSPALDAALEKALRFDPAQRFSTMEAFAARLENLEAPPEPSASRYRDRKLMKRTRSSIVFKAIDAETGASVALKKLLLDPKLAEGERRAALTHVLREAKLAASLSHPNLVSVTDSFIEDGDGYLVMEWLEGRTLREWLDERTPITLPMIRDLAEQVGGALAYAHGQGVVHRDIKPENIIYHEGRATVLDFGIATGPERTALNEAQRTAGTARYIAPETLEGGEADTRADVFSFGVVLYELLTGAYPYDAPAIMARYAWQAVTPPAAPAALNLDCPPEWSQAILKALAIDPEKRFASVSELVDAFAPDGFAALYGPYPGAPAPEASAGAGGEPSGSWGKLALVAGVAFVLCLGLGVAGMRSYRDGMVAMVPSESPSPVGSPVSFDPMAAPNPSAAPSAAPSPSPLPSALAPAAAGSPKPAAPSPAPPAPHRWASAPVSAAAVTVQLLEARAEDGSTTLRLRVENRSESPVSFLDRSDRNLFRFVDAEGHDLSDTLDPYSVDADLLRVEPGTAATGGLRLKSEAAAGPAVGLTLRESGGEGREFSLTGQAL